MAITGSGTSADPYIVTTYGELVQAASRESKYIEFPKEPGTINIEDEYGKTEPPQLVIRNGVHINGNGWEIHGLWGEHHNCISRIGTGGSYMNNLTFSSFHSQSNYFLYCSDNYPQFQISGCIFSGICEKDFMYLTVYSGSPNISYCSITINFPSLNYSRFICSNNIDENKSMELSNCNIKLKSAGGLRLFEFTSPYGRYKSSIRNCCFDLTSDNCRIFNGSASNTIVSSCIFIGDSQSAINIGNGTPQTVNVFDEEAFPNAVGSTKFVGVPHDKIGDAAYLSNLGFPIGV